MLLSLFFSVSDVSVQNMVLYVGNCHFCADYVFSEVAVKCIEPVCCDVCPSRPSAPGDWIAYRLSRVTSI